MDHINSEACGRRPATFNFLALYIIQKGIPSKPAWSSQYIYEFFKNGELIILKFIIVR